MPCGCTWVSYPAEWFYPKWREENEGRQQTLSMVTVQAHIFAEVIDKVTDVMVLNLWTIRAGSNSKYLGLTRIRNLKDLNSMGNGNELYNSQYCSKLLLFKVVKSPLLEMLNQWLFVICEGCRGILGPLPLVFSPTIVFQSSMHSEFFLNTR